MIGLDDGGGELGADTVKLKVVVLVTPPPVPVAVMVEFPAGVVAPALMVKVEEQAGLQLTPLNEAVAPVGSPDAEKLTDCVLPETRVALIVLVTGEPAVTDLLPPLLIEKSKD